MSLGERADGTPVLRHARGGITLGDTPPGLVAALARLSDGGATVAQLSDLVLEVDGTVGLARLYYELARWEERGLVCYSLVTEGRPLARIEPISPSFRFRPEAVDPDTRFVLSRFAYSRRQQHELVLESPRSHARVVLAATAAADAVALLARPRSSRELGAAVESLDGETARTFLGILSGLDLVSGVSADGAAEEDADPALAPWEFHDLLFHARSRPGRHDGRIGATFRFRGTLPPLPAVKPRTSDRTIALFKPDLERLKREDPPLALVQEVRRSTREYGEMPITEQQVGELLYRVGRVRRIDARDPARFRHYEASSRPYPSGGASYGLELYLTVDRCEGIPSGLYHYDPLRHQLGQIADRNVHTLALLRDAQRAAGLAGPPPVLIILAARFQRVSWKYEGIAYALILKEVGVLFQTMYLAAAAMGLAPCALGAGNSDLLAAAVGTDYFAESSVGEFLLGTRRSSP